MMAMTEDVSEATADVIVSELTHRFFNSLQILNTVFRRAAEDLPFSPAIQADLSTVRERIGALSRFNRGLSVVGPGLTEDHCRDVCLDLLRSIGREDVRPWFRVSDVRLPEDRASRTMLLLSELFLNAVKHGGDGELRIDVTLDEAPDGTLLLEVANDGRSDARVARRPRIADALARSLGAELHFTGGAWCVARAWLPRA